MKKLFVMTAAMILLLSLSGIAKYPVGKSPRRSSSTLDTKTWIAANQILMMQTNKGSFAFDQGVFLGKSDGLYFPFISLEKILNGSQDLTVYFAAGVWISGVDFGANPPETLATVAEFSDEFTPGPHGTSFADGNSNPLLKVYKLYSDSLKDNPNADYLAWPVSMGAPVDANGEPDGIMLGDQMLWSVYHDDEPLNHTNNATGVDGLGVEIRQTTFAFSREGALSNMVFLRYRIYNKGGKDLDSVYLTLWADPDLGDASDDLVGCDTILSLGFVYNGGATDANYGDTPPAGGFDFFQGPVVPGAASDTAIAWDFQKFPGMKNLGMTAYSEYPNGKDPQGATQAYHYMQGKEPNGDTIVDPSGAVTTYEWSGDPVAGTGFLDSNPGDRRYMVNTGPFTLAPGDSTEIVAAVIIGRGKSQLASITTLKTLDAFAQSVYDGGFQLPEPPATPDVTVTTADGEVFFKWGTASEDDPGDYNFEGYVVLQGPSPVGPWEDTLGWHDITNGVLGIKDLKFDVSLGAEIEFVAKPGRDEGLKHFFRTTRDVTGGGNIVNYTEYFYRVEAYSFDPAAVVAAGFKTLTSATIVTVLPEPVNPGITLNNTFDDALVVTHTGSSDGSVTAQVVDPEALTGMNYAVSFSVDATLGPVWHLVNTTTGDTLRKNQTNQAGDDNFVVTDGFVARVSGPPLLGKSHAYAAPATLNISPVVIADQIAMGNPAYGGNERWYSRSSDAAGGELLFGGVFMEPNFWGATTLGGADYKTVEIHWRPMVSYTDLNADGSYTIGEPYVVDDPAQTQSAFMYPAFTSSAYLGFFNIPFTAWDVSDPANPRQLNVVIRDRDQDNAWNFAEQCQLPDCDPTGLPNGGDQRFNYTWILSTDYDPTGTMYGDGTGGSIGFFDAPGGAVYDAMWTMWLGPRGSTRGQLAEESIMTLTPNFVNTPADVFAFNSTAPTVSASTSVADLENIKTVPNPYNLSSSYDNSNFNRRLRFTNLPNEVTIQIFNLAGELVSTIEKNDSSTDLFWDMENDFGIPIGSGIYIYVVDAPGFGQKIGKTAIFVETELLDQF